VGTILGVKLAQDIRDVVLHGALRQHKSLCDLTIAGSGSKQLKYFSFTNAPFRKPRLFRAGRNEARIVNRRFFACGPGADFVGSSSGLS
jgi:hypothetical protein